MTTEQQNGESFQLKDLAAMNHTNNTRLTLCKHPILLTGPANNAAQVKAPAYHTTQKGIIIVRKFSRTAASLSSGRTMGRLSSPTLLHPSTRKFIKTIIVLPSSHSHSPDDNYLAIRYHSVQISLTAYMRKILPSHPLSRDKAEEKKKKFSSERKYFSVLLNCEFLVFFLQLRLREANTVPQPERGVIGEWIVIITIAQAAKVDVKIVLGPKFTSGCVLGFFLD